MYEKDFVKEKHSSKVTEAKIVWVALFIVH